MSRHTLVDIQWHKEKRFHENGVLRHPIARFRSMEAGILIINILSLHMTHARNIRLGLVINGFNPFGIMSNNYSMQLVVLMPYNMPPWKCMKDSFFMMSLLISRLQALSKDMDMYLCPLVDKLKELWNDDVHTFDMLSGEYFRIHACLMWTINDFLVYGNMSG